MNKESNIIKFPVFKRNPTLNTKEGTLLKFPKMGKYPKSCPHKKAIPKKCVRLSKAEEIEMTNRVIGISTLIDKLDASIPHEAFLLDEYSKELKQLKRRVKASLKATQSDMKKGIL